MMGEKERGWYGGGEEKGEEEGENRHTKFMTYFNKTHAGTKFACILERLVLRCDHLVRRQEGFLPKINHLKWRMKL